MLSLARQNGAKFRRLGEAWYLGRGRFCVYGDLLAQISTPQCQKIVVSERHQEEVRMFNVRKRKRGGEKKIKNIVRIRPSNHFSFSDFNREILLEKFT